MARTVTNSSAAAARLLNPLATSSATRSSVTVSSPEPGARPLTLASSSLARAAQSAAPAPSRTSIASDRVARAARRCLSRR